MSLKCNMPPERQQETLKLFDLWTCDREEEIARDLFEPILFYEAMPGNDRTAWCTNSRTRFDTTRKRLKGKHKDEVTCPICQRSHKLLNVNKYSFSMSTLESQRKIVFVRKMDGALLLAAGTMLRRFTWDTLFGDLCWRPERLYYLAPGEIQMWETARDQDTDKLYWKASATIREPFAVNMMGYSCYDGSYHTIGLDDLSGTPFEYSQIVPYYEVGWECNVDLCMETKYVVKYLATFAMYPQVEMAVKLELYGAVDDLVIRGKKNHRILNWAGRQPAEFLRMSKADARLFMRWQCCTNDLSAWRRCGKGLSFEKYIQMQDAVGGAESVEMVARCAEKCGVDLKTGVKYARKLCVEMGNCWNASMKREAVRIWKDYLDMAEQLDYDFTNLTVTMPKDLRARHDAAAELIDFRKGEAENKKYRKRYLQLRRKFEFTYGGLTVVVPDCSDAIVQEGNTLVHCVGGYAQRHISGKTVILFIRKERRPERSFLTVELTTDEKPRIRQVHGYRNERYRGGEHHDPEKEYAWFLDTWLKWVREGSPRDNQKKPRIQEVKTA